MTKPDINAIIRFLKIRKSVGGFSDKSEIMVNAAAIITKQGNGPRVI